MLNVLNQAFKLIIENLKQLEDWIKQVNIISTLKKGDLNVSVKGI